MPPSKKSKKIRMRTFTGFSKVRPWLFFEKIGRSQRYAPSLRASDCAPSGWRKASLSSQTTSTRRFRRTFEETSLSHLLRLPLYHRDPFDRMLICQALHHELVVVTLD